MQQPKLTTVANVNKWLDIRTDDDRLLIDRLIGSASRFIMGHLNRPTLFQKTFTDKYDGNGTQRQYLKHWPVLSVSALTVDGDEIDESPDFGEDGYTLQEWDSLPPGGPQAIDLTGYLFCRGARNVSVSYVAGYAVHNEAQTVPGSNYTLKVDAPYGPWAVDQGVTFANGTALTLVSSGPTAGQYSVSTDGVYTFAAANTGQAVLISYSYVPADLEQLCIELVAERYRYKDRIGQTSKSMGGQETVAYSITDLPAHLKLLARPYRDFGLC